MGLFLTHICKSADFWCPVRNVAVYNCRKHPLFYTGILLIQFSEQVFYILSFCIAVCRTGAFYDRKLIFVTEAFHICFRNIHQRADHRKVGAVKMGDRRKRIKMPFVDQRHHHGFYNIILVMGISYFIAAQFFIVSFKAPLRIFAHREQGFFSFLSSNTIRAISVFTTV